MPRVDPIAEELVDARLGRPPRDVLEAAVLLEAWDGRPAGAALTDARDLVSADIPAPFVRGRVDPPDDRDEAASALAEAIALVLSIVSVAAWARPLSRDLGPVVFQRAIQLALPVALGLQWGLRSRYLSRPRGLWLLRHDGVAVALALAFMVGLPIALHGSYGPLAALLVLVWVGGTIVTCRGWGLAYAAILVAGTIPLTAGADPYTTIGGMGAFTVALCVAALLTRRIPTDDRPGKIRHAAIAATLGGGIGLLLVADPTLGWGVHGLHPAISLVPSVVGSFLGGHQLLFIYRDIPRGLSGVPLEEASRIGWRDPAIKVFAGAVLRLLGATVILSLAVVGLGGVTGGTDAPGVFVAFGAVALLSLVVTLLESMSFQLPALVAVAAALGAELAWRSLGAAHVAGAGLTLGAAVGVAVAVPPLIALLSRSGRVLATTLWIR
jgi:hypothetical protein